MKSRTSSARLASQLVSSAALIMVVMLAAPISILARVSASPRATRLTPRHQSEGDLAARTSETTAGKQALDAERAAYLDELLKQLDGGAPFSLEETRILHQYAAGTGLSTVEADVVISRALYATYISGEALNGTQAKILDEYREVVSRFETGILDAKALVLADEAAAGERTAAPAPANDASREAEVLNAGAFPIRSTPIADVSGARSSDTPIRPAAGEPVSRVTWYAFTPEETGRYRISTSREDGNLTTLEDTVITLFTGERASRMRPLPTTETTDGFDDDSAGNGDLQAVVVTTLEAGTRYLIAAGKRGDSVPMADRSALQISIDRVSIDRAVAADTCAGATALLLNTPINDTTVGATNDYQLASSSPCFTANGAIGNFPDVLAGPDVVYTFTAPAAGTYSIRVQPTNTMQAYDVALYTASVCPSGAGVQTVSCLTAADRRGDNGGDEIKCQPLTAGQLIYIFVDGFRTSGTLAGAFELEVVDCVNETEANNTTATANALVCGQEGSLIPITDVDFYSLGTPAIDARIFAIVDGGPSLADDYDLRVTTTMTTLEYDDLNNVFPFGANSSNVAGTPATGVATYLRVNYFSQTTPAGGVEPYRIVSVVQPPIASATAETEANNTTATANFAANNYFSGALTAGDIDIFSFQASAGDLVYLGLDGDPLRNNTPINGALALLDGAGAVLVSVNDSGATSSTTAGGTLSSTSPFSPAEGLLYRIRTTGTYYARAAGSTAAVAGDYLLSISKNCQTGGGVQPAPTLNIGDVTQAEGNGGATTFSFPLMLSAPAASAVVVTYSTADGSASAGSDYAGVTNGTTTIPVGQSTGTIAITVNGDTTVEPDETFTVSIVSATNATVSDGMAIGTITNDDATALSINDVSLAEGNAGTTAFTFTITLSAASASTVTVNYATADGTATIADNDYAATSGMLTFAPTVTMQTVTVLVNGDIVNEANETFFVNLTGPSGATIADGQGQGTIVNDDTACVLTCPANVTQGNDANQCGAVVTYPAPTTTGSCGTVTCSPASGLFFPVGTTTVTCTATTGPTCTFTVTVNDTQAPAITCPVNVTQSNDANQCSAVVTYSAPNASDNCPGVGTPVCSPASGSSFPVGTTTVTCTVSDASANSPDATCTFTVTVNDTQAPAVTCPANVTQANDANQCSAVVTYAAPTASDNCPGVTVSCLPASGSSFPVGTTTVTCTATDASANSPDATCTFTVTVNDTQAPAIACPANITQGNAANQCGAVVNYPAPTASDNCPGVTVSCSPAAGSFFPVGTTTVTCTAADASANSPDATCMFTVTVNDTQAPAITCPANITTTGTGTSGCSLSGVVTYPAPTVSDNCPGVGAATCVPASGSTFPEGTTTVTCTVADATGNTASCSFTVTVSTVGAFGACAVDDASGDTWSIVTSPSSPNVRYWRYRVAATGEVFCGTASALAYTPGRSLTASDTDDPVFSMTATLNYGSNTGTVKVLDRSTGRQFVLRDRNLSNNPPCQ